MSHAALTWGLIGASSWASERMIDAFTSVGGGEVRSVHSASRERGERFASDNGLAQAHARLGGLLADPEIDAVYVSTTNDLHADQVVAAAEAGKHILCEKPMATTLADAIRMRDACSAAGVVLGINHHMRCQDTVREMRRLIDGDVIGQVLSARVAHVGSLVQHRRTWRVNRPETGAGVVLDLTVHDVDALRFLLDDEIEAVTAMTATQGVAEGSIDDAVVGTMRTARGTLVSFHDAFTLPHIGTSLEVHGTTGSLLGRGVFSADPVGEVLVRRGDALEEVSIPGRRNPYVRTVEAFADAVHGSGGPAVTGEDGIASLAVALAVLDASRSGSTRPVEKA